MWSEEPSSGHREGPGARDGASAKQLEKLNVYTGHVLIIDQFMLANQQFLTQLPQRHDIDAQRWVTETAPDIRSAAQRYGGALIEVANGSWGVLRDPGEQLFVLLSVEEGIEPQVETALDITREARGNAAPIGQVFVDTRCVVFVDAGVLSNDEFLAEYRNLRQSNQDKAARDVLRSHGAAVRYGFNRDGDELGVFRIADGAQFALWPDVVESPEIVE